MRSYVNTVPSWLTALIVCISLLLTFPLVWKRMVIPNEDVHQVLIIAILVSIALITFITYQFFNTLESARLLQ